MFGLLAAPMLARDYTIAIVGLVHGHVWGHLERLAKPGAPARLVGVSEPNPVLAAEANKITGTAVPHFDDYRKMLDQVKPDIVWAFVENNRHREIVEVCAPRKIHMMFEKPLAATLEDALAIQALAKRYGIQVMTNYQMAWWPTTYAAKARADAGAVGAVWRLHGIVGHGGFNSPGWDQPRGRFFREWLIDPAKNGGGALIDFGCYNALWSLWYLGKPETVYAQANHLQPKLYPKVEDNADLVLHYANGVGIFEGSWDLPRGFQDLEILGRTGSLRAAEGAVSLRLGDRPPETVPAPALAPERAEPVAYFVSRLKEGKDLEGLVALPINIDVVAVLDAAKRSIQSGRAERIDK